MRIEPIVLSTFLVTTALATACSTGPSAADEDAAGRTASGDGSGTASGSTAGGDDLLGDGAGGDGAGGAEACASAKLEATLTPLGILVMFDKSGSMEKNDKWGSASGALVDFVSDPKTAGLRLGLRFFPDAGCDDATCDASICAQPLIDAMPLTADPAPGDAQEGALVAAIEANGPDDGGGTPISAALAGGLAWATAYRAAHPGDNAAVLLLTDGAPNGCDEDEGNIVGLAEGALQQAGVRTFAVGLSGSNEGLMDDIAQAGGTEHGFFVDSGSSAKDDLLAALAAIQGSVLGCEIAMPAASGDQAVDPAEVNVTYTPGDGGAPVTVPQVAGAQACADLPAWYYDDPASPTKIVLCPAACGAVQGDAHASLEVVLGCATEIAD